MRQETTRTLLSSMQMAEFASRGFVRLDGVVPTELNEAFLSDIGDGEAETPLEQYSLIQSRSAIPVVAAGTPLDQAFPENSTLARILDLPRVAGAIRSLVGDAPLFDHHFLHMTFPPRYFGGRGPVSQHTHQDSTIDPRRAFDIQLMYFPQQVTREMGGTRFVPGTHLRKVSEAAIGRYQNIKGQQHVVCEPGTVLFMHMDMWHGGGCNVSDQVRYMFKIRLVPTQKQERLWDTSDLPEGHLEQRPIFWTDGQQARDPIQGLLTRPEPWFEADTGRLEYVNRIRFWRQLLGDDRFDADYWVTRLENEPE